MIKLTSIVAAVALMSSSLVADSPDNIGQDEWNTWHGKASKPTDEAYNVSYFGSNAGHDANGGDNTYIGHYSGYKMIGSHNTFIGFQLSESRGAGWEDQNIGKGSNNIFIGHRTGEGHFGDNNIFLGDYLGRDEKVSNTLYIGATTAIVDEDNNVSIALPLISGNFLDKTLTINGTLDVEGNVTAAGVIKSSFNGDDTANNHNMLVLDVNNTGAGNSDVGFSLENKESDFKWTFRTYNPVEGFAASKIGTGGTEFEVGNIGTNVNTTVVKMGGVKVFENGKLLDDKGEALMDLIADLEARITVLQGENHEDD